MASIGLIESQLNALPEGVKTPVTQAFREAVKTGYAIGLPDDTKRATNFRWFRFDTVTSSVANTEFTVHHRQGAAPLVCWPVMFLDSSGGQIVRLKITRPADAQRIYLSSPDTSASVSLLAEF
jgi:hypothetical protein